MVVYKLKYNKIKSNYKNRKNNNKIAVVEPWKKLFLVDLKDYYKRSLINGDKI